MAFIVKKHDSFTGENPFVYKLMTNNEGVTAGEALVETSGRLTKCGATATPMYIAQKTQAAEATSVTLVPVSRVTELEQYEVRSTATVASTLIGSKVTIDSTGLLVTATTTSGVFYIDETDGATTVSLVRGHFRV